MMLGNHVTVSERRDYEAEYRMADGAPLAAQRFDLLALALTCFALAVGVAAQL